MLKQKTVSQFLQGDDSDSSYDVEDPYANGAQKDGWETDGSSSNGSGEADAEDGDVLGSGEGDSSMEEN